LPTGNNCRRTPAQRRDERLAALACPMLRGSPYRRVTMGDQVTQHFEQFGTANTPTAKDSIRIDGVVEVVKHDNKGSAIHINVTTTNFAIFDNATGAISIGLLKGGAEVASYVTQSPRNPGRGFQPPTVRQGFRSEELPAGLQFDRIGFKFANLDDANGFSVDWEKVIEIGVMIIVEVASAA
jgi:hypothetical protein